MLSSKKYMILRCFTALPHAEDSTRIIPAMITLNSALTPLIFLRASHRERLFSILIVFIVSHPMEK